MAGYDDDLGAHIAPVRLQTRLTALDLAMGTVDMDLGKSGEDPTPPFSRSGPERNEDLEPLVRNAAP